MRVFVGIDLDDDIRNRIDHFMKSMCRLAPDVRWASAHSLHVTLKFIGNQSNDGVRDLKNALAPIRSHLFQISYQGYQFFPNPKSPQIFALGVKANNEISSLAAKVEQALVGLGVPQERRPYNPHITLARLSRIKGGRQRVNLFQSLQGKLSAAPPAEFGTMTARKFFLYESKSSPEGSLYIKIAHFDLQ